jgi:hypothetical protein
MKSLILFFSLMSCSAAEAVSYRLNERVLSPPHTLSEQSRMEKILYGKVYRKLYDYCNDSAMRLQVASGLMVEMDFQVQNFKTKTYSTNQIDKNGNQNYITSGTLYSVCWLKYF